MRRDLDALAAREHDLLVVGAGIYGAAAARDAAQRGLQVALLEAQDFGVGVSWNSLKTIHGGLRYLQKADLGRMRASIRERRALLHIAPDLVCPLPFLLPTYGHGWHGRELLGLALALNDLVAYDRNRGLPPETHIPPGRTLSRGEVLERVRGVPRNGLTGGGLWCDAQVRSSERLVLGFVLAAAGDGALVANHAEVTGWHVTDGRVTGVRVRDHTNEADIDVRARMVLNAAGPALERLLGLAGVRDVSVPLLRATNLVLRRSVVEGVAVGMRDAGRFLFAVPWEGRSIIGTDYEPAEQPPSDVRAFVEVAARAFPWIQLEAADVALVHRGLVPGQGGARGLATRPLLVDHERRHGLAGLISVLGVKYTTARAVAEAAVDLVFRRLGRSSPPCRSAGTPLPGARLLGAGLEAATRTAVREEMALNLSDAVLRRLDLGTAGPPAPDDLERVERTMATELGWSHERVVAERRALTAFYRERSGC